MTLLTSLQVTSVLSYVIAVVPGPRPFTVPTGWPCSVTSSQEPVNTERIFITTFRSKQAASGRRKRRLGPITR